MQTIADLIVRIAGLAEAEGRVLRSVTIRVALGIGLIIVAAGAVTAGAGLVLGSVLIVTTDWAGTAGGAAITGVLALGLGGVLAWLGHRMGT